MEALHLRFSKYTKLAFASASLTGDLLTNIELCSETLTSLHLEGLDLQQCFDSPHSAAGCNLKVLAGRQQWLNPVVSWQA